MGSNNNKYLYKQLYMYSRACTNTISHLCWRQF